MAKDFSNIFVFYHLNVNFLFAYDVISCHCPRLMKLFKLKQSKLLRCLLCCSLLSNMETTIFTVILSLVLAM